MHSSHRERQRAILRGAQHSILCTARDACSCAHSKSDMDCKRRSRLPLQVTAAASILIAAAFIASVVPIRTLRCPLHPAAGPRPFTELPWQAALRVMQCADQPRPHPPAPQHTPSRPARHAADHPRPPQTPSRFGRLPPSSATSRCGTAPLTSDDRVFLPLGQVGITPALVTISAVADSTCSIALTDASRSWSCMLAYLPLSASSLAHMPVPMAPCLCSVHLLKRFSGLYTSHIA
jgi:hypothetical protein